MNMRKVAFVTGAVRNTGLAIVRRFAQEGYDVALSSRDIESAQAVAATLKNEFPEAAFLGVGMDPAKVSDIHAAFGEIDVRFGRLDAFVSNAAHLAVDYNTFNMTEDMWDAVLDANAKGTFFCCQEAVPLMKKAGGGSIVAISSVHANQSIVGRVAYSASKAAINAMMRCMAVELGYLNIRANALLAGAIWTERWASQTAEQTAERRKKYPAGRESSPDEIANAVYFLCSDQACTITGTELTVDSGISVCLLPYNKEWNHHE